MVTLNITSRPANNSTFIMMMTTINWDNYESGEHPLTLQAEAGSVEAILHIPEGFNPSSVTAIAVCCHPHPLFQGTMTNKVTHTLAKVMTKLGMPAIRFNFRGVGQSEGVHDNAVGETDDLIAICGQLKQQFPQAELWLSGFSFGSYVAANAAAKVNATQLISISPAVENYNFTQIEKPNCPWLVVMGDEDEIVSPEAVFQWVENAESDITLIRFPQTGHFYHRMLVKLTDCLLDHYASALTK